MAFSWTPSSGNDRLRATAEGQTINALGGNDWLYSAFNDTYLYGGSGHDRLNVDLAIFGPTEQSDPIDSEIKTAYLDGGYGNDWLVSKFTIERGGFMAAEMSSRQSGGAGNDNISISAVATGELWDAGGTFSFDVDGGEGDDSIWIEATGDNAGVTNFVSAGGGDDLVYIYTDFGAANGNSVNTVDGGDGDDHITVLGNGGYDAGTHSTIRGGDGDDYIESHTWGNSAISQVDGGEGNDTLIVVNLAGGDASSSIKSHASGGNGHDIIEMDSYSGSNGGGQVEHVAYGGRGNDVITSVAKAGVFTEDGGYGHVDVLIDGGTGHDVLTATTIFSPDDEVSGGARLLGGAGNDTLRVYDGVENTLDGGTGDDVLIGGSGADRIIGGAGADTLRGAAGNDTFVFQWIAGATPDIRDTILDFGAGGWRGDDVIDLSAIDANAGRGGNQAFAFGGTTRKGVGFVWVENDTANGDSLVMANNGGTQPLVIAVADGSGRDASDWRGDDFLL